ncbi:hypothetical protein PsYK624_171880 [Phanerochaete sordida]|uniref:Uncharacterized protein n=1 Tax=Phanerochaete sordida TaxID=48140 RepID=A0A9P3LP93_9APHY|nr:hypothetical protein PsYK624_171880 [Phanerochaete sordida]
MPAIMPAIMPATTLDLSPIDLTRLRPTSDPCGHLPYLRRLRRAAEDGMILTLVDGRFNVWKWPVDDEGRRVPPCDLWAYRQTHVLQFPSCMCVMDAGQPDYVETAIFCCRSGVLAGQYVAACVRRHCKYFVLIEHLYASPGLHIGRYPARIIPLNEAPPMIDWIPARIRSIAVRRAVFGPANGVFAPILRAARKSGRENRPVRRQIAALTPAPAGRAASADAGSEDDDDNESEFSQLLRLDSFTAPGLSLAQFVALFCVCNCGQVMTRRTFRIAHECSEKLIIDLTLPLAVCVLARGSML